MCFCQFVWSPAVFAHYPPTTREGGQGQWGFMKSARSFVLRDEAFGLIGAGCQVEEKSGLIRVTPRDGLRKTIVYPEKKLRWRCSRDDRRTSPMQARFAPVPENLTS